jgi:ABC-2 type transporter
VRGQLLGRGGQDPLPAALGIALPLPGLGRPPRTALIRLRRTPQLLVSALVVPVMFLLTFRYIFGGAIPVPGISYVDYLIPALLAQNAIFDGFGTAAAMAADARDGVVDRFRALPMARSAVLTGRALADLLRQALVLAVLTAVAVGVGFRFHTGPAQSIAGLAIALLFGQVLFWAFAAIGFGTANPESAAALTTPFMLLVFVSSALEQLLGHTAGYYTVTSLLWGIVIVLAGATLALRAYRRL